MSAQSPHPVTHPLQPHVINASLFQMPKPNQIQNLPIEKQRLYRYHHELPLIHSQYQKPQTLHPKNYLSSNYPPIPPTSPGYPSSIQAPAPVNGSNSQLAKIPLPFASPPLSELCTLGSLLLLPLWAFMEL